MNKASLEDSRKSLNPINNKNVNNKKKQKRKNKRKKNKNLLKDVEHA